MRATVAAVAMLAAACVRLTPWRNEPAAGAEVNLAFTIERNLIQLDTLEIDGRRGVFILGTATPRTVVDVGFPLAGNAGHAAQIGDKVTVKIDPVRLDLGGVADAIIGADVSRDRTLTIDYFSGVATYTTVAVDVRDMKRFRYDAEPMIHVNVDGRDVAAIVDTTTPDTLVLPSDRDTRATAAVRIADTDFGPTDVRYATIPTARVGNRLLSRFLVTIDYRRQTVGLWRDPRVPV